MKKNPLPNLPSRLPPPPTLTCVDHSSPRGDLPPLRSDFPQPPTITQAMVGGRARLDRGRGGCVMRGGWPSVGWSLVIIQNISQVLLV